MFIYNEGYNPTLLPSPRSQGYRSEISRRIDDGLHPSLLPVLSPITEGEEECCVTAAITGSREEGEVNFRRAVQNPGPTGGDPHPQ